MSEENNKEIENEEITEQVDDAVETEIVKEDVNKELEELNDRYKRLFAEFENYKNQFLAEMESLKKKFDAFPENYKEDDNTFKTVLDTLLEAGVFPTYSFPKDVVGFYIEDDEGKKIVQKPERSLDMAISEYAPGRIIVVNKDTYKSGGIYSFHSKFQPLQSHKFQH